MGATLHFLVVWLLMFIGLSAPDFFTKSPHMVPGSRELPRYSLEALFLAGFLTLSAISRAWNEFMLEVASDHIIVFQGKRLDPLHRQGQTIPRSQIREVAETWTMPIFDPGIRGLLIKYGRWSHWSGKRIFLPAGMPNYAEVKAHLLAWNTNVS